MAEVMPCTRATLSSWAGALSFLHLRVKPSRFPVSVAIGPGVVRPPGSPRGVVSGLGSQAAGTSVSYTRPFSLGFPSCCSYSIGNTAPAGLADDSVTSSARDHRLLVASATGRQTVPRPLLLCSPGGGDFESSGLPPPGRVGAWGLSDPFYRWGLCLLQVVLWVGLGVLVVSTHTTLSVSEETPVHLDLAKGVPGGRPGEAQDEMKAEVARLPGTQL